MRAFFRWNLGWSDGVAILAIGGILAGLLAPMPSLDWTPILPPNVGKPADPKLAGIAGRYAQGRGGESVEITPDGRYAYVHSCCVGVLDKDAGFVRVAGDRLILSPWRPTRSKWTSGFPEGLIVVRWGPRRYLVPAGKMSELCLEVCQGVEPRDTGRYSRYLTATAGSPSARLAGLPEVPEEWRRELPERPVFADPARPTPPEASHGP